MNITFKGMSGTLAKPWMVGEETIVQGSKVYQISDIKTFDIKQAKHRWI